MQNIKKSFRIFSKFHNPVNIEAYTKAEEIYKDAYQARIQEENFNTRYNVLLNNFSPKEEYDTIVSPTTGTTTRVKTATKEQVFQREFNKVAKMYDEIIKNDKTGQYKGIADGKSFLNKY